MQPYTYTIFDAHPAASSGSAWPTHSDIEIETESYEDALDEVRDVLAVEAAGLSVADGYTVGQALYALVRDLDGANKLLSYMLTAEDLSAEKSDVTDWDTADSYVATFPSDGGDGACDVSVQVGGAGGVWYLRTVDDAGGDDLADETAYPSQETAEAAAEAFVAAHHEGLDGEDAADFLLRILQEAAGEPDPEGRWCVYWDTVGDDSRVEDRYPSQEAATAACSLANDALHRKYPGGNLLCGYTIRQLVDGDWVSVEGQS